MPDKIEAGRAAAEDADQDRRGEIGQSKSGKSKAVAVAGVTLSHPDRVYWEDAGVTKQMLAEYYTQVWDWMRPHVDRPRAGAGALSRRRRRRNASSRSTRPPASTRRI